MNLGRLNNAGLRLFEDYLVLLKTTPTLAPPVALLDDPETSEQAASVTVDPQTFANRLEAGRWLHDLLERAELPNPARDKGLWAWLSLRLFDQVCPADGQGNRKPGKTYRHISDADDYKVYYRHLLNGPWRIFRMYKNNVDCALALLCQAVDRPGDVVEQICANQELVTNRAVVEAATSLYVNAATKLPKYGTQTKGHGGPRRYVAFFNQLDVTWDLYAMEADELLEKLPKEFDRFRTAA